MISNSSKHFKVALYIRVSTEEQAENPEGSIKNQEERLRQIVRHQQEMGTAHNIVGVFVDAGLSAKNMNRPGLQRMLKMIEKHDVNLVMVTELSRLSRSTKDFCEMWEFFQKHQCEFHSLREHFDTTNAAGELMLKSFANFAEFERRQTAERISASFRIRAERGLYNGGAVPFGYKIIPGKSGYLEVKDSEAEIVRKAFQVFLSEGTLASTAKWLNTHGYKLSEKMQCGGGKSRMGYFMVQNLHHLLANKAYIGVRVFKTKDGKKETKAVWPGIIDELVFHRVQKIMTKNYVERKKPARPLKYPYVLTGMIFCGSCGQRLCGKSAWGRAGKYMYYEHSWQTKSQSEMKVKRYTCLPHRFSAATAEELVWQKVKKILEVPSIAHELIEEAKKIPFKKDSEVEAQRLESKMLSVTQQIDSLTSRLSELPTEVSAEPIYRQMQKLGSTKSTYQEKLNELRTMGSEHERPVTFDTYEEYLRILSSWQEKEVTSEIQQKILTRLIDKIELFPEYIKVHYFCGENKIQRELAIASSLLCSASNGDLLTFPGKAKHLLQNPNFPLCSASLTFGGGGGSLTPVPEL